MVSTLLWSMLYTHTLHAYETLLSFVSTQKRLTKHCKHRTFIIPLLFWELLPHRFVVRMRLGEEAFVVGDTQSAATIIILKD